MLGFIIKYVVKVSTSVINVIKRDKELKRVNKVRFNVVFKAKEGYLEWINARLKAVKVFKGTINVIVELN